MNALEELREYVKLTMLDGYTNVDEIVDRIEAEYMELPKDCNGDVIHVGDTVKFDDLLYEVAGIAKDEYIIVHDPNRCGTGMRSDAVELVKPEQPDSMEQIKADAAKESVNYWNCKGYNCDMCSAVIDGKTPLDKYGVDDCLTAQMLDLIARTEKLMDGEQ